MSALRALELHGERIAEEQRIVRVEADWNANVEVLPQRVRLDGFDDARADVGERTQHQRDAPGGEVRDERWILARDSS